MFSRDFAAPGFSPGCPSRSSPAFLLLDFSTALEQWSNLEAEIPGSAA
jgi:hypothetical protein